MFDPSDRYSRPVVPKGVEVLTVYVTYTNARVVTDEVLIKVAIALMTGLPTVLEQDPGDINIVFRFIEDEDRPQTANVVIGIWDAHHAQRQDAARLLQEHVHQAIGSLVDPPDCTLVELTVWIETDYSLHFDKLE